MKTTKEMIEVMQAYEDGKDVECDYLQCAYYGQEDWALIEEPIWNWHEFDYRIKPEPRVFYALSQEVSHSPITTLNIYNTRQDAEQARNYAASEIIKLQEVLE